MRDSVFDGQASVENNRLVNSVKRIDMKNNDDGRYSHLHTLHENFTSYFIKNQRARHNYIIALPQCKYI